MILAGILFKLGAYGLLRFGVFLLPRGAADMGPVLLTLAAVGITYGALITIMQRDLKRLVAYASIVDVAFIVLGTFAFSAQGVTGGVMEMVNHGLTTGAIFFLVGVIWERRGTLRISDLGGLQKSMPILAAIFLAVVMSAVGLPGLNGFVGEFLVLVGTFITHRWWAVVATTAIVSGAIYLLWAYQRVFHGPIRIAGQRRRPGHLVAGDRGGRAAAGRDRVPRGLPEALPRPGDALGEPSARPRPGGRPVRPCPAVGTGTHQLFGACRPERG